ncbi:MAG: peptidase [Thermoproteota archaeon]
MWGTALFSVMLALFMVPAFAEVWIPENEYVGYFDSQGVYTVVGAVKNTENYAITPTITIVVHTGEKIAVEQKLPTVFPNKDIPFKIQIPQVTNNDAILEKPSVVFQKEDDAIQSNVEVIYDKTLKKHRDGHLTGRIINKGNVTEHGIKVYSTIHGDKHVFLDVGKNIEKIEKIKPGQIIEFTMYPDPLFADDVNYYSCFAIGDETIVPLYAIRNGERFDFRYDSTASFTVAGFDETGTKLYIDGINSFKVPTFVNFEFPKVSDTEKFDVLVNEKPVEFIQSVDEYGNWHVAFAMEGASQTKILISGFENPARQQSGFQVDIVQDYAFLYYVIPVVFAGGVGVYFYVRKKSVTS